MTRISRDIHCRCCGEPMPEQTGRRCVLKFVCAECRAKGHTDFNCRICAQILEEELRASMDELNFNRVK